MKLLALVFFFLISLNLNAAERAVPVRVAAITKAKIQQLIPITGLITAPRISKVSTQVDALIIEFLYDEGAFVKQGDILVKLDKVLAEIDLQRSQAAVTEAKSRLQEHIRKRDELGKLIANQYLAKTSYETAVAEVQISKAIVKRLEAAYLRNQQLLKQHHIKAPFNGVIRRKTAETGEWIKVGESLLELVDMDSLRVEIEVPQSYYPKLQKNTQATITFDALPQQQLVAPISQIIPVADATAHTFPVHFNIDNRQRLFTPGMTTRVALQLNASQQTTAALLIPRDALIKKNNQADSIWVIKSADNVKRVYPVEVSTGRVYQKHIEILEC